jgi:hypothetical protein
MYEEQDSIIFGPLIIGKKGNNWNCIFRKLNFTNTTINYN